MKALTISSKFEITIPKEVRERLKLKPGSKLELTSKGGIINVVPFKENEKATRSRRRLP